jgi:hypothetical protein
MTPSELVNRLIPEMFQTEESAKAHPKKDAERFPGTPPAAALLAVSAHAELTLVELQGLAKELGLEAHSVGRTIGRTFSMIREAVTDRVMSDEKNYRGTLLGLQHGVDLFTLVEATARRDGKTALALFCARWLEQRRPLVEAVRAQIPWFAEHLEHAR